MKRRDGGVRCRPGVGLAAAFEERNQHRVVLVAAVVLGFVVQVGEQLHALKATPSGFEPSESRTRELDGALCG